MSHSVGGRGTKLADVPLRPDGMNRTTKNIQKTDEAVMPRRYLSVSISTNQLAKPLKAVQQDQDADLVAPKHEMFGMQDEMGSVIQDLAAPEHLTENIKQCVH